MTHLLDKRCNFIYATDVLNKILLQTRSLPLYLSHKTTCIDNQKEIVNV